jgi:hypothetical protein
MKKTRKIKLWFLLLFILTSSVLANHPEPKLIISQVRMPDSVFCGTLLEGTFGWNLYSGDNQSGRPVWVMVCGIRDSNGRWVGNRPIAIFLGTPGAYPGRSAEGFVRIRVPEKPGIYTIWAHANPTNKINDAVNWFKGTATNNETNTHRIISRIKVLVRSSHRNTSSGSGYLSKREVPYIVNRRKVHSSSYAEAKKREIRIVVYIFVLGPIIIGVFASLSLLCSFFISSSNDESSPRDT